MNTDEEAVVENTIGVLDLLQVGDLQTELHAVEENYVPLKVYHFDQCDFEAENFDDLHAHISCYHGARPKEGNNKISYVSPARSNIKILNEDLSITGITNGTPCNQCGKHFPNKYQQIVHIEQEHVDVQIQLPFRLVSCSVCEKTFQNRGSVQLHMTTCYTFQWWDCQFETYDGNKFKTYNENCHKTHTPQHFTLIMEKLEQISKRLDIIENHDKI